jgi:hypothetical protein
VSDVKAKYKAASKKRSKARTMPPIRRGSQDFDFSKLPAFGMWKDRPETDEEILEEMRSGWGPPPFDD